MILLNPEISLFSGMATVPQEEELIRRISSLTLLTFKVTVVQSISPLGELANTKKGG